MAGARPLLLALLLAAPIRAQSQETDGPHARQAALHASEPDAPWTRLTASDLPPVPRTSSHPRVTRRVHGYLPYWENLDPASFRWDLVTDVIAFSAALTSAGAVSNWHGWPQTGLIAAAHARGVRVHLCATLFNSSSTNAVSTFLSSASARSAATRTLVQAVRDAGADGLNLDLEPFPTSRSADMTAFVAQVRTAFETAVPGGELSLAMPAIASQAPDAAALAANALLLSMQYDYHWGSSPTTGAVAPLPSVTGQVDAYLRRIAPSVFSLGVPWYGFDWPASGAAPGASTTARAAPVFARDAVVRAAQFGRKWDAPSQTPWYTYTSAGQRHQAWYDDSQSLALKYSLANDRNLAGVMIWALGYEPPQGDFWTAIETAFAGGPEPQTGVSLRLDGTVFTPLRIRAGEEVRVLFSVTADGTQAVDAASPAPGTVYDERSDAPAAPANAFRLAADVDDRPLSRTPNPWRWGLASPLAPGGQRVVEGRIRLVSPGMRVLRAAVVREGVGVVQSDVGVTAVEVLPPEIPDAGPADAGRPPDHFDAGSEPQPDAGMDAGATVADAGRPGTVDAGRPSRDGGTAPEPAPKACGCGGVPGTIPGALLMVAMLRRSRRSPNAFWCNPGRRIPSR